MLAVVSGRNGRSFAWMVVEPAAAPAVTGTWTLLPFAGINTVPGMDATEVLSDERVITRPPAGAEDPAGSKFKVKFCVPLVEMKAVWGEKLRLPATETDWLPFTNPDAEAVIVAAP